MSRHPIPPEYTAQYARDLGAGTPREFFPRWVLPGRAKRAATMMSTSHSSPSPGFLGITKLRVFVVVSLAITLVLRLRFASGGLQGFYPQLVHPANRVYIDGGSPRSSPTTSPSSSRSWTARARRYLPSRSTGTSRRRKTPAMPTTTPSSRSLSSRGPSPSSCPRSST